MCHACCVAGKTVHAAVGRIALVMCLGCASAGIVQVLVSGLVQIYKRDETFNTNEIANVVLGGLVAVTGCCPFIDPRWALLIGGMHMGVCVFPFAWKYTCVYAYGGTHVFVYIPLFTLIGQLIKVFALLAVEGGGRFNITPAMSSCSGDSGCVPSWLLH